MKFIRFSTCNYDYTEPCYVYETPLTLTFILGCSRSRPVKDFWHVRRAFTYSRFGAIKTTSSCLSSLSPESGNNSFATVSRLHFSAYCAIPTYMSVICNEGQTGKIVPSLILQ